MNNKFQWVIAGAVVVALVLAGLAYYSEQQPVQVMGVTNLDSLHMVSTEGTATPILMLQHNGGGLPFQVNNTSGTPVFYSDASGNVTYNGFSSGGGVVSAPAAINAPTAVGTATPAFVVNSLGAGDVLLDVRKASTPVFSINNDGSWSDTGAATHSSGHTFNNWVKVSAPTAIATATPAMVVDSLGVSSLFEARYLATPVFSIYSGGTWADAGAATHSGLHTFSAGFVSNNAAAVKAATAVATATPSFIVDNLGAGNVNFEVRKAATPQFAVLNNGNVDVNAHLITNIGNAATDFDSSGGLTLAAALDMSNAVVKNIGNAGTDFDTGGGLTLAAGLTVGTGYLKVTASALLITNTLPITPSATYMTLTSAASMATSTTVPIVAAGHNAGEIVILRNANASDTITIDGTGGTVECKADVVLGASDTLTLIFNGSAWNCLAGYDNS